VAIVVGTYEISIVASDRGQLLEKLSKDHLVHGNDVVVFEVPHDERVRVDANRWRRMVANDSVSFDFYGLVPFDCRDFVSEPAKTW
jgi:uncharacterized membrane protein